MTVGSIQFDSIFSAADSLRVADVSGLAPLSFNPPSPESLGRFLSSMSDGKPEVCSIRLALDSIAQNLSSPRDVSKPVVAPDVPDSRAATIAEVPVAHVVPVAKAQVVESPDGKLLVVEKPVVEAPVASAVPATPTAPVARVVETVVVEKPVVEAPVAPAAPATPTAPVAQVAETLVAEKPVVEAPVAPAAPVASSESAPVGASRHSLGSASLLPDGSQPPTGGGYLRDARNASVAQVAETLVAEKPVVEAPIAPAAPITIDAPDSRLAETLVVEKPVVEAPVAPAAPTTPTAPAAKVVETIVVGKPVVEATIAPVAPAAPTAPFATPVVESPVAPVATPVVESPVAPAAPVAKSPVVESSATPVVEAPVAKSEVASAKPVVSGKRTAAPEDVVVIDLSQESARAAVPLREAPFVAAAQQEIAAATASARTEAIVEVVNNVAEAIADQILVTPSLVRGEGQMIVRLKPEVLDGSEIRLSSESGTLAVEVVPSTPNAAKLATEAMPRLEAALAEHVSAFRQVSVSVRKGKANEVV